MRPMSGRPAPGDPLTSSVTVPFSTPTKRMSPPRAITDGSTLACSAAVTLSARSTGPSGTACCLERCLQVGDEIAQRLDSD